MKKVVIIDYGFCNLDSVYRAVQECGGDALVTKRPEDASSASRLILPGVGSFAEAMKEIRRLGWDDAIRHEAGKGIPLFGICLGMQLLADSGIEGGDSVGLGLIPGRVIKLQDGSGKLRIPHVGWNEVHLQRMSPLFEGIPSGKDFYFVHSYHFETTSPEEALARTPYGTDFVSVVERANVVGAQFHPEKSLRIGFQLLRNFIDFY